MAVPFGSRGKVAGLFFIVAVLAAACANGAPSPSPTATIDLATATPTPAPSTASPTADVLAETARPRLNRGPIFALPQGGLTPAFITTLGEAASSTAPVTVTIAAAGDIACDPGQNKGQPHDCDQAATAGILARLRPTAVLTLGDNQYEDNTLAAYQEVYDKTWGKYKSITFPTIGNHEYLTADASGYFDYFGFPSYYSFDLGNWHIVSLNSECHFVGGCAKGSPQEQWFLADLAAHPSLCTLVTWHEPRWSSGEHQDATQMDQIWRDLVAAKVDVVLTGHNHDYERFGPLGPDGLPDPNGTPEFVVGTGGKNHYGFAEDPLAGELVRNDASFGVIQMTLSADRYSWQFVAAPGYHFEDSGDGQCH